MPHIHEVEAKSANNQYFCQPIKLKLSPDNNPSSSPCSYLSIESLICFLVSSLATESPSSSTIATLAAEISGVSSSVTCSTTEIADLTTQITAISEAIETVDDALEAALDLLESK